MNGLEHFTALIQLISAVNFAYIVPYFNKKVYGTIFNEEKFYSDKIVSFQDMMAADIESLKRMRPKDNNKRKKEIDALIGKYNNLNVKWEAKKSETETMVDWVMNRKGFKSLFLFTSLFCVIDLFNIAMTSASSANPWVVFAHLVTLLSFLYVIKLTHRILWSGWKQRDDDFCYKRTIRYFATASTVAAIGALVNEWMLQYTCTSIPQWLTSTVAVLSVVIPFFPCVFTFLFIGISVQFINIYTDFNTKSIRKEQEGLSEERQKLEDDKKPTGAVEWRLPGDLKNLSSSKKK